MSTKTPRKRTVFQFCAVHNWLDEKSRYDRARYASMGGPAHSLPCDKDTPCRVLAGTDLFIAEVCHGEYQLNWACNNETATTKGKESA